MIRAIVAIFAFIGMVLTIPLEGSAFCRCSKEGARLERRGLIPGTCRQGSRRNGRFFEIVKKGWQEEKVERAVWLVRRLDGSVTVFSPSCPHLGCGYRWIPEEDRFKCPCHISVFDISGKVLGGPAPRPLDTLQARVEGNKVFVKFEVFQVGTSKKMVA